MLEESLFIKMSQQPIDNFILKSQFDVIYENKKKESCICYLLEDSIVIKINLENQLMIKINFTFELTFQLLRKQKNQFSQNILGQPYGIKFQKFQQNICLQGKYQQILIDWRNYLQKKLNQRGFHEIFKPIKKIGKGSFASVYLVIKHEDKKSYAVKAFSKQFVYNEQKGKQSLLNEIQIMRMFNHKNIMKLNGVYQSQNSIYCVVQLLEGGQLYDKIKYRHKFTQLQIKNVMKGLLQGLQVLHQKNIMHRDLKPQNILLRNQKDYDCVIADFGLSQSILNNPYLFQRCGTPGYTAPQIVNLKDPKGRYGTNCDLFSVGVVFHLLALRKPPFRGMEINDVLRQNRQCQIDFQSATYAKLHHTWLDLLKKLLQKDPLKRISATQALNHQFFTTDSNFFEFIQKRNVLRKDSLMQEQCQSPLLMTKDSKRKNLNLLKNDSCLKFEMRQNILTGRTDQKGQTIDQITSPAVAKTSAGKVGLGSRFKRMAK